MKKHKLGFYLTDEDKELFKDVVCLVEATHTEQHMLWIENFYEPRKAFEGRVKTWTQEGMGHTITIGHLDKRPICVTMFCDWINGQRVMFYDAVSQVVDRKLVEDWLQYWTLKTIRWDNGHRWAHCDAMNFAHALEAVDQANEKAKKKNEKQSKHKSHQANASR